MNFHQIFIEIATAPTISNGFLWNYVQLLSRSVFTSSNFFLNLHFFFFLRIFIIFSLKSLLLLQFPMDSFETRYTYSLGQSSHLLFRFLKCVFFNFLGEFSSNFHSNCYCSYNISWITLKLGTEIRYWLPDFEIICGFWMFHIRIAATA